MPGPIDANLLRRASATRGYLAAGLAVGVATAVLTLAQAWLIAFAIFYLFALGSGLVGFDVAAPAAPFFVPAGADLWGTLTPTLLALALVFLLKGLLAWLNTWLGNRAAAAVKSQLRTDIARARLARPVDAGVSTGGLITLVTQGLDALDGYYSKYLPQLLLAATVPFIVGFAILTADLTSAVILALTLPLIPVFMILVGWTTQARTEKRWAVQTRLANHFADLVLGLPTLQVFGRAKAQAKGLLKTESAHRRETMATLRLSFMSALVLELLSTLSVAIVAVVVGFRVVFDTMDLRTALFVLILAPEAYLPVRQVGAHFHDSADGVAAAQQAFAIIGEMSEGAGGAVARAVAGDAADGTHHAEAPHRDSGDEAVRVEPSAVHGAPARRPPDDDPRIGQGAVSSRGRQSAVLSATGLSHTYPGASAPALEDFNLAVAPGEIVVLTGPSGCGKTTVLNAVMGFLTPTRGQLLGDGRPIADWAAWRGRVAYVGQNPGMVAGTVADNVRLGFPQATDLAVRAALDEAGAAELPLDHPVGMDGEGVSAGERRRVATARALLRVTLGRAELMVLDEPTAGLDAASEAVVLESLRRLGVAALVVTHRPAVRELADRVVRLDKGRVATGDSAGLDGASARLAGASAATVAGGDASPASRTDGVTAEAATADAVSARDSAVAAAVVGEGVVSEGDGRAESRPVVDGAPGALPEPSAGALTGGAADEPGEAPPSSGARHKSLLGRLFDAEAGSRARLALALALAWAATFAAVALMGVSSWLLAFAATLPSPLFLEAPAVMVRFFAISRGVFRYTERLASHDVALRLQSALRLETYKSLARTTLLGTRRGDLLTRVIADVEAIQDLVVRVWIPFGSSSLVIVVSCLLVGLVSPGAAAVLFGTAVLAGVVVPWLARKASERADADAIPTRGELADRVHELARTAPDLVAYGADAAFVAEYQRVDKLLRADEERSTWVRGLAEGFQTVAAGLAVVGALWIGATQIGPDGFWTAVPLGFTSIFADPGVTSGWRGIDAVGFAFLAVLALTPLALHESLSTLAQSAQHATRAQVALRRVTQVLKAPKVGSGDIPDVLETAARPRLTVANLSAGWPGGDAVVEGLTLDVGPGRRVALTGPSGVGKTTVAATVLGLIPALGGELAVTGRPGYLAQDAHIFNTSVAENVRIGRRDATADDVAKALARAGLAGLDLDRVVGEEGSALSGGEARRVALARLLVGDYQVLVLDEPTEHLDAVTAAALMDDIWSTAADLPILVITHDADVMARCDEVIRLGRLAW